MDDLPPANTDDPLGDGVAAAVAIAVVNRTAAMDWPPSMSCQSRTKPACVVVADLSPVEKANLSDPARVVARFPNHWRDHGFS